MQIRIINLVSYIHLKIIHFLFYQIIIICNFSFSYILFTKIIHFILIFIIFNKLQTYYILLGHIMSLIKILFFLLQFLFHQFKNF